MDAYSESELTESDDRQIEKTWKFRKFQKKGSHCIPSEFNIKQAYMYKLGRSQTCHISNMSQRKHWIYARKNTPQSTMTLLNRVHCMVSENLPVYIQIVA